MQAPIYPNLAEAGIAGPFVCRDVVRESDFIDDLKAAFAASPINQTELAKLMGFSSQSAVSNIFKRTRKVSAQEAAEFRRIFKMQEGPPVQWVPLIGLASAGSWQEAVLMPMRERPIPHRMAGQRAFAVEIVGDSMDKLLPEGGWAVVDPDQTHLYAGKVYLIANEDEETTVKRYCGDPARFEPVSNNDMHEPLFLANIPYRVIGRIVSYGNDGGL